MGVINPSDDDIYDYGLFLLNKVLGESGKSLENWPTMPIPQKNWERHHDYNPLVADQLHYNQSEERAQAAERLLTMNEYQAEAFRRIIESVEQELGNLFFLSGPGGTGKTFVYKTLCNRVRGEGWVILVVASSGIAALLIPGGRTSHSMFKIPIEGLNAESLCNIPKQSARAALLRMTKIII
ncbi:PIF1-like helicase-domain-containing protein, partial [Infundibulicybe gibba]